ncbi:MAG TPA: POTRA domain-containing protein [Kofleriaceae bacterium]|nr:POTRA domain-containing protein [Kofleriaceae bacterium]
MRVARLAALAVGAALAGAASPVAAQPVAADAASADGGFGPLITIEAVEVVGNTYTAERLIRRALRVTEGEELRAGDSRLRDARHKILALGYFREVDLRLRKGSARGRVVLTVRVVERGTVVLNRMYFGRSKVTPWWAGLDLTERNFFGTGIGVGGGFVFAGEGEAAGAQAQKAFQVRLEDPSILGGPIGWLASVHGVWASEPFRVAGAPDDGDADNFAAFDYSRLGGRLGATVQVTPFTRLTALGRAERVRAALPDLPGADFHLEDGESRVVTGAVLVERDTRPDPILPYTGEQLLVLVEAGAEPVSSYDQASVLARGGVWRTVAPGHVLSAHLMVGGVMGSTPLFDRLHVGDVNRMVAPRALGLVVSTAPPLDLFDTGADEVSYGNVGGLGEVQYAKRLFRARRTIYGGDLFVGAGLWSLYDTELEAGGVDVLLDAGLRLDTEIGIFELSLANGLGRIPL